ncbi:MAG: hypothetical protein ACYS0H_30465, partial [Planctomycetota bacterium]
TSEDFLSAAGIKPPEPVEGDWRESIKDDAAKKFAEDSSDLNHLVTRALDMRQKLAKAVIVPGKNAKDEEIAAYRKAMNIPAEPKGYEFPEVDEITDEVKTSRETWSSRFHELGLSKEQAKALGQYVNEDSQAFEAAQVERDKQFATEQEDSLKSEWKGDYEKNKTLANRAFNDIANRAGIDLDVLTKMETKDGRFLMDNAPIVRMFAAIGREMAEGTLGPTLTESEQETLNTQIEDVRAEIAKAQGEKNSKKANQLYQKEQALLARMHGNQPIVGSAGRTV